MTDVTLDADNTKVVRTLNVLLRGEISASQTYGLAIPLVADNAPNDTTTLRAIARQHDAAVETIRAAIEKVGGKADSGATVWPSVVKTVVGAGKVFVAAAALKALKEGEEGGLNDYRTALSQVSPETSKLIRESLIPARIKHIGELEEIIARL